MEASPLISAYPRPKRGTEGQPHQRTDDVSHLRRCIWGDCYCQTV